MGGFLGGGGLRDFFLLFSKKVSIVEVLVPSSSSSNAARRCDDGYHVSRPRCVLHALSWLRMPMRLLQLRPQCRHM